MLSLVPAGHAVEGLLSAVIMNIVVGLITSLISGASVANVRMQSHLARFLPGVSIHSYAPDSQKSAAIVAGGREFLRERDSREYVLVAKVRLPDGGHPLFLICGQTGITNRAAASYLRDNYRRISSAHGARESWCVVLRVVAPSVYGHQMTELAADVSGSAFSALAAAGGPA